MNNIFKTLLIIPLLSAFAFNFSFAQDADQKGPQFKFEKEVHDFGTLAEGPKAKHQFKFTNTGDEPLIITNARASCGCTVPNYPKEPILPGQEASINVEYNTKNRIGGFNKSITITSNAVTPNKVIYIKGTVRKEEPVGAPIKKPEGLQPMGN